MPSEDRITLSRRALLGGGGALLGAWLTRGWDVYGGSRSFDETLRALAASLTPGQRQLLVFPADHPSRQIVNAQTVLDRPHLGTLLSPTQRGYVQQLYAHMLSPHGRDAFAPTIAVEGRFDGCVLAIYGDPESHGAHVVLQGGHLMLRGGGAARENPFGGGISYGHQTGNGLWKLPGNSFAAHNEYANALFAALSPSEQAVAIQAESPHELVLQPQDERGRFHGISLNSVAEPAQIAARSLIEKVLAAYPESTRHAAWGCLDANGGLAALHFATYAAYGFYSDMSTWADHDEAAKASLGIPYWQVWRLEGPGTVIHFKGSPHVHAYIQLVRDPHSANVGSVLATTTAPVEGPAMRRLLEAALCRASRERMAYYGNEIPGRFAAGEITTGLAYSLDPYRSRICVATLRGSAVAPQVRADLASQGIVLVDRDTYRIATTDYIATQTTSLGEPERIETSDTLIRDALVEHLRADALRAIEA